MFSLCRLVDNCVVRLYTLFSIIYAGLVITTVMHVAESVPSNLNVSVYADCLACLSSRVPPKFLLT
jgi:hypothetical protein